MTTTTRTMLAYLEQIEEFFLSHRGRGLMVSPDDAAYVRELESLGVPADVVCRGVARAFADRRPGTAPGAQAPQSLRACRGYVDVEIDAWRAKEVGRNDWQDTRAREQLLGELAALLSRIERLGRDSHDPQRTYYRRAWRGVRDLHARASREGTENVLASHSLAALESKALADFLGALAPIEQVHVRREAESRVSLSRAEISARAWEAAVLASLEAVLRETYCLVPLVLEAP
jgi:hypothetical protein